MKPMTKVLQDIRNSYTFRLRKEAPTFLGGVSSLLDIQGEVSSKYNTDTTDEVADFNALHSDWNAVGKDLYFALNTYGKRS